MSWGHVHQGKGGTKQIVERGGDGHRYSAPMRKELGTWPTSQYVGSISLFVRHVNNYFAFCSSQHCQPTLRPIGAVAIGATAHRNSMASHNFLAYRAL